MDKHAQEQMTASISTDRRSGRDRRTRRWGNLVWFLKSGQRRRVRRRSDRRRIKFLDYYSPKLFYVMTLVLLLSVIDALLTLWLIEQGASEINPVMAYFLQFGPNTFMLAKYLLTAMAVIIVVLLNYGVTRYLKIPFRVLMPFFACCFAMVVAWELFLIARLPL